MLLPRVTTCTGRGHIVATSHTAYSCCYATQEYISSQLGTLFSFVWMGGCEKIVDDASNWRLSNCSIPWNFKYWLMCLWCTFLTEHEVINRITFSTLRAVHGLSFPALLSSEPVSISFLAASKDFACSNSYLKFCQQILCSISCKHIQLFDVMASFMKGVFTNTAVTWFPLPWKNCIGFDAKLEMLLEARIIRIVCAKIVNVGSGLFKLQKIK